MFELCNEAKVCYDGDSCCTVTGIVDSLDVVLTIAELVDVDKVLSSVWMCLGSHANDVIRWIGFCIM